MSDLSKRHPQRDFADGFRAYKRGEPRDGTTAAWLEGWDAAAAVAERDAAVARAEANRRAAKARQSHIDDLQKMLDASEAERDGLRAVLRPFAKAADNFDSFPIKDAEGWFAYSGQSSFNKVTGAITVGDLRRARAALGGQGDA